MRFAAANLPRLWDLSSRQLFALSTFLVVIQKTIDSKLEAKIVLPGVGEPLLANEAKTN